MSWGISENASDKEKLKAEINDYFHGLNAVGKIDWNAYSELYDVCIPILDKCYDRMNAESEPDGFCKHGKKFCEKELVTHIDGRKLHYIYDDLTLEPYSDFADCEHCERRTIPDRFRQESRDTGGPRCGPFHKFVEEWKRQKPQVLEIAYQSSDNGLSNVATYQDVTNIEPCEDCISRQAVLDTINSMQNANPSYWNKCDVVDREDLIEEIGELPPVIPTRKKGKWIIGEDYVKCPICGETDARLNEYDDFCPACGAELEEDE